ncbi:MAG: hypothetical protein D4R68_01105, partial [Ignavibacteriales bacterium]
NLWGVNIPLQEMNETPGKMIRYVLNLDAILHSKPATSLSAFLIQRRHLASKATGYKDPFMILTTLLVFAANLEIIAALAFSI